MIQPITSRQFTTKRTHVYVRLGGRINFDPMLPHEPLAWIVLNALDYIDHPWDEVTHVAVKRPSGTGSKRASKLHFICVGRRYQPMEVPRWAH